MDDCGFLYETPSGRIQHRPYNPMTDKGRTDKGATESKWGDNARTYTINTGSDKGLYQGMERGRKEGRQRDERSRDRDERSRDKDKRSSDRDDKSLRRTDMEQKRVTDRGGGDGYGRSKADKRTCSPNGKRDRLNY